MTTKHSSGLDFSDRAPEFDHPDVAIIPDAGPAYLRRNKTERRRLQGLMRPEPPQRTVDSNNGHSLKSRWDRWMVNDGGRFIFFAVCIFLQIIVLIFGIANYQLKDNFSNARAEFGATYLESQCLTLLCLLGF
jgi:NADPH oxidase 2